MSNPIDDLRGNFKNFMELTLDTYTLTRFAEAPANIDLKTRSSEPASIWDGAYSIRVDGMGQSTEWGNQVVDLNLKVVVQVAFEFSANNKQYYYDALNDITTLITKRLNPMTYGENILNITHTGTTPFTTAAKSDSEVYQVADVQFSVTYRKYYFS